MTTPEKSNFQPGVKHPIYSAGMAGLFFVAVFIAGCAWFDSRHASLQGLPLSQLPEKQKSVLHNLALINAGLNTFKGVGRLIQTSRDGSQSFRVAWVGAFPDSIRIEILDPVGRASLSLSSDGRWLYAYDHNKKAVYKRRPDAATFNKIIATPIAPVEILHLFAGRVPILSGDISRLRVEADATDIEFDLREAGSEKTCRIKLMPGSDKVHDFEVSEPEGQLLYRVSFSDYLIKDTFHIPRQIDITGADEFGLRLLIERFWSNMPVQEEVFHIEPPQDSG